MGDTARTQVWAELSGLTEETWSHVSGLQLPLRRLAIDAGFATQEVYAWARRHRPLVMAVKGVERGSALIGLPTAVDVTAEGKRLRRGVKVTTVAGGIAKLELFNNLRKTPPTDEELAAGTPYPAGYVHLPKVDAEYCKQLSAEQLVTTRNRRGYTVRAWQKMRERNEALDAYVYARAAAAAAGLDRFEERHWRQLERQLGVATTVREIAEPAVTEEAPRRTEAAPPRERPRDYGIRRSDWFGGRTKNWLRR
jgi:phage terminase large subunit GpA-like protein